MASIDIPLTGPAYKHRSLPVAAQTCRNWYPEVVEESPYRAVLAQPPGSRSFGKNPPGSARDRGMHVWREELYKVSGTGFYRVTATGQMELLGTINGSRRCVFASSTEEMVIVTNGQVYRYKGGALQLMASPVFEEPNGVAFLNSQAIYDGDNGRFVVSSPGDLVAINGLNYATAESAGDALLRPYVHQQTLYLMGTATIESWYNSGSGNPPFARIDGGIVEVGLGAVHSAAHNDAAVFFLSHDRNIYALSNSSAQRISTIPLAQELAGYSRVSDAIGFCFTLDGQDFYQLQFPTENRTWCYNLQSGAWFERTTGQDAHLATSYAFCYGRHLIGHRQHVLEWTPDVFEDFADEDAFPIIRERITAPINGRLLGVPGRSLHMARLEVLFEPGQGVAWGQGQEPQIMMAFSDDNGLTWSNEQRGQIGRMGNFLARATWHGLGQFQSRVIRFRVSDPVPCTLLGANSELEACL